MRVALLGGAFFFKGVLQREGFSQLGLSFLPRLLTIHALVDRLAWVFSDPPVVGAPSSLFSFPTYGPVRPPLCLSRGVDALPSSNPSVIFLSFGNVASFFFSFNFPGRLMLVSLR